MYEIVDECGTKGGMLAVEIALNQYGMKGDKIKASLAYIKEHPELKALDGLEETTISMLGGLFIRGLGRVGLADPVAEVLSDKGAIEFLNAVDQETQYKFLDDLFISSHRGAPKEYFMDVVSGQKEPYSFEPVQVKE